MCVCIGGSVTSATCTCTCTFCVSALPTVGLTSLLLRHFASRFGKHFTCARFDVLLASVHTHLDRVASRSVRTYACFGVLSPVLTAVLAHSDRTCVAAVRTRASGVHQHLTCVDLRIYGPQSIASYHIDPCPTCVALSACMLYLAPVSRLLRGLVRACLLHMFARGWPLSARARVTCTLLQCTSAAVRSCATCVIPSGVCALTSPLLCINHVEPFAAIAPSFVGSNNALLPTSQILHCRPR